MQIRLLFYSICLLLNTAVWSQKWVEKGHKQFEELAYSDAIVSLEKAVDQGYRTPEIYKQLADSYYFNANYKESVKWYKRVFKKPENILPVVCFRYALALKSIGKYDEAETILELGRKAIAKKEGSYVLPDTLNYREIIAKNSGRYQVELAPFNSATSDFGTAFWENQIVFTSARDTGSVFKRNHSWTNQSFTDLYMVNPDSVNSEPVRMAKSINSKFNESTAVFTKDGLTMYFTRNNFNNGKRGTDKNQTTLLKIYKAVKMDKDKEWKEIEALPFCSDNYNVAHPALSPDEQILYFASDKPGGFGQSDLYKVAINVDGTFGEPENLGATINTSGRETFPFVSQNNELYFASDGQEGLGGLDVFVSQQQQSKTFSAPVNVGEPINSTMDDFAFIINTTTKKGYFSSNRSNGVGMDDIYSFEELKPLPCKQMLKGRIETETVLDSLTKAEISVLDTQFNLIKKAMVDQNGTYQLTIDCVEKVLLKFELEGYVSQTIKVEPKAFASTILQQIKMEKEAVSFQLGDDIAKKLSIQAIYFDLGKSYIRPDAAIELSKIKKVLLEYPSMIIDIRSHTDSRDTFENNQALSNRRAQATLDWFVTNGIEIHRLTAKGYGETQLLNDCSDGVPCSEDEHQLNRRSEFIITGI